MFHLKHPVQSTNGHLNFRKVMGSKTKPFQDQGTDCYRWRLEVILLYYLLAFGVHGLNCEGSGFSGTCLKIEYIFTLSSQKYLMQRTEKKIGLSVTYYVQIG